MKIFSILFTLALLIVGSVQAQSSRFQFSGNYVSHQSVENAVDVVHERGKIRVEYFTGVGFRVRYGKADMATTVFSNAIDPVSATTSKPEIRDDARVLQLTVGDDVLLIQKQPVRITFQHRNGSVWSRESFGAGVLGDRVAPVVGKPENQNDFGGGV